MVPMTKSVYIVGGSKAGNDGALLARLMMFAMCMQKDNKKNLYCFYGIQYYRLHHWCASAPAAVCNLLRVMKAAEYRT